MNKKVLKLIYIIVPVIILLIAAGILAGPIADGYFSDKTVRKLKIGTVEAGGKTKEELDALLASNEENASNVKIKWGDSEFEISISEAGITPDSTLTAENAMKAGRESFGSVVSSWYKGVTVPFDFTVSEATFKESVTAAMTELGILSGSYSVTLENGKAFFVINEDSGDPDTDSLLKEITEKYPDFSEPFVLNKGEVVWPTAEQIRDDFNIEASDAYMQKENGETKIVAHKEGREIDFEALKTAIDNREKSFSVSYKVIKPKVYTEQLGDENFPVLLGKCVTSFNEGAVNRSSNIRLATSKINGYVMNKGDVFSFNGVVGKRTHATGFKDAPVYTGSGVEDGVGGGICQVSSTLYGAVLEADLKIVSRVNHNYTVSYTKPGFDATVSYGTIDFKFSNSLNNPIKIKAEAKNGQMIVYIYGTKQDSNTVSLGYEILGTTPRGIKRVYNPALKVGSEIVKSAGYDGMKVRNFKYIKDSSGKVIKTEDLGVSTYITLDKVIEYNDGLGREQKPETSVAPAEPPKEETPAENNVPASLVPVNPTQPSAELDPEISGNAVPNVPVPEENENKDPLKELEDIISE